MTKYGRNGVSRAGVRVERHICETLVERKKLSGPIDGFSVAFAQGSDRPQQLRAGRAHQVHAHRPLSDDPIVFTGAANFSEPSTTANAENMLVIRGDTRVADIYLGEFTRLFPLPFPRDDEDAASRGGVETRRPGVAQARPRAISATTTACDVPTSRTRRGEGAPTLSPAVTLGRGAGYASRWFVYFKDRNDLT